MKNNRILWLTAVLAIAGIIYSLKMFDKAFPIVNVRIQADKHQILARADSLSQACNFMQGDFRVVAAFDTDQRFKNYMELEAGGVEAFQAVVDSAVYHPYTWIVRQFNVDDVREVNYHFTPSGRLLGFKLTLPDSLAGADIPDLDIMSFAQSSDAPAALFPDLSDYELIEKASEVKESGRRDHVFTFEHRQEKANEARYRIRIGVSGEELSMVLPFVWIPESFDRGYEEMRSSNATLSLIGVAFMVLLYGFAGLGVSIFFMMRRKTLIWKEPLTWSGIIAVLIFFALLSTLTLSWFQYDTSLSSGQFILQQFIQALINALFIAVIFFLSAMAATGLDRQAFPQHLQFWRLWSPRLAASREVLRQTIFGYLWALFMIGFVTFFYWFTNHVLKWWSPAENLVDPNILAIPFPSLLPVAQSLQAGFWEECLFRAVPLAGAVLLAKNFRKKKFWIVFALFLQAVVFGAMHANYPQQPAYARIVEMIIPFMLYGLIYMRWGLLPVVVSHFVYDVILMSLPLFLLSAPGIGIQRFLAIFAALIPLLIPIYQRIRARSWYEPQESDYNAALEIPLSTAAPSSRTPEPLPEKEIKISKKSYRTFPLFAAFAALVLGAVLWLLLNPFESEMPRLGVKRAEAITLAEAFLTENTVIPDSLPFKPYVSFEKGNRRSLRFVKEKSGDENYRRLCRESLALNYFEVVFKSFEGDVQSRSEEFVVRVGREGEVLAWEHKIPEQRAGERLTEEEARTLAREKLQDFFGIPVDKLEEVRSEPEKLPKRNDWTFIYRDPDSGLEEGEFRYIASLAGSEVKALKTEVHSSENWERQVKKSDTKERIFSLFGGLIRFGLLVTFLIMAVVAWTKKRFSARNFFILAISLFLVLFIQGLMQKNSILSSMPTSQPFSNIMMIYLIGLFLGTIFAGFFNGLPLAYLTTLDLPLERKEPAFIFKGIALGLLSAGVFSLTSLKFFSSSPVIFSPPNAASPVPLFSAILDSISEYIFFLLRLSIPFVLALIIEKRNEKHRWAALLLLFLSGFTFTGSCPPLCLLLNATIYGLFMMALYLGVLRFNMLFIPIIVGLIMVLDEIQLILINPGVLTFAPALVAILTVLLCTIFTLLFMNHAKRERPDIESE